MRSAKLERVTKETNVSVENDKTKTTVTTYTYDDMGNLLTTQSEGDSATYVYDKAGRTLRVTQNGETIGAFNTPAHVSRLVSYIKSDNKL